MVMITSTSELICNFLAFHRVLVALVGVDCGTSNCPCRSQLMR